MVALSVFRRSRKFVLDFVSQWPNYTVVIGSGINVEFDTTKVKKSTLRDIFQFI